MKLNGTFDVKLGQSFFDPNAATFMTMRYDFMPASVDRSQPGSIKVDEGKEVVVNLPNVASVGPGSTCFRGSARPVQKECILIYNKRTGELTLERVAHAVQLKKTREERKPASCLTNNASTSGAECQQESTRTKPLHVETVVSHKDLPVATSSPPKRKSTDNSAATCLMSKPVGHPSVKPRALSSSSSGSSNTNGSSESETSDNESIDAGSEGDTVSQSSNLSSLSGSGNYTRHPTDFRARSSVTNGSKSNTNSQASNFLPVHRKLIEHDLKLSDTDSDDSS